MQEHNCSSVLNLYILIKVNCMFFKGNRFLNGKNALVTGSAKKLGAHTALGLAEYGANIILNYRESASEAEQLMTEILRFGVKCIAVKGDVSVSGELEDVINKSMDRMGSVDILINNAGPWASEPFHELSLEKWDLVMNVNLRAAFEVSKLLFPAMKKSGWGRIINVSSNAAFMRNQSIYGLAKNALNRLTESLALEFAPDVNVNAVAPGLIWYDGLKEQTQRLITEDTPLKRLVTMNEVAEFIAVLCSPVFDSVTGQVIVLDGGQSIPKAVGL